jgi:exodeoxyribonuclease VII large subunit
MQRLVHEGRQSLRAQGLALHALSPLAVLDRGYAIALRAHGEALRDARDAKAGERLTLRLAKGSVAVEVVDET